MINNYPGFTDRYSQVCFSEVSGVTHDFPFIKHFPSETTPTTKICIINDCQLMSSKAFHQ